MKLNREKAEVKKTAISFMGHLITSDGLLPDPSKIDAITKLKRPTSIEEIQRLCGTVNYLARFLLRLSIIMEPTQQLMHKDVPWIWLQARDTAFTEMKRAVTEALVLAYYNLKMALTIQCDTSSEGLGAALLQQGKPVAYANRVMTDTEQRYAQIKKEMLAIVFSLEKFHQYTYGRRTEIYTDHKPLEAIVKKTLAKAPKRLQGMLLQTQKYDIDVVYLKGKHMYIADMLSRSYMTTGKNYQAEFELVNMVSFLPIRDERLTQIRKATNQDEVCDQLRNTIIQGWPTEKMDLPAVLHPYFHTRDEMSVQNGLIFKGDRVLIPLSLQSDIKRSIHSSYIGIDGCLRHARECVFWPEMSSEIRKYISTCETCCKFATEQPKETIMPHDIPDRPWQKVGIDLCESETGVPHNCRLFLKLLGDRSIRKHNNLHHHPQVHFARYGIPCQVISDAGTQFTSSAFKHFSEKWDFKHLMASPGNQQANGKAESTVKSAKRLMRKKKTLAPTNS